MALGAWDVFLRLLTFVGLLIVFATTVRWVVDARRSRRHSAGREGRRSSREDRRAAR